MGPNGYLSRADMEQVIIKTLQDHLDPVAESLTQTARELELLRESLEKRFDGFLELLSNKAPESYVPQSTFDGVVKSYQTILKWVLTTAGVLIAIALGIQGANSFIKSVYQGQLETAVVTK